MINKLNFLIKSTIWFLFVFASSYYLLENNYEYEFSTKIILLFLYLIIFFVITFGIYKAKTNDNLPIFILTNIYFFLCYILFFFFDKSLIFPDLSDIELIYALKIFGYGYIAFSLGYFINYNVAKNIYRKEFKFLNASSNEFFIIGSFCLFINLIVFELFNINKYFSGLSQLRYVFIIIGIGLLVEYLFICLKNKNSILKIFLSCTLIFLSLFSFILNAALSYPFMIMFLIVVYYSYRAKKIYIYPLLITATLFLFLHMGKYNYRDLIQTKYTVQEPGSGKVYLLTRGNQKNILQKTKDIINSQIQVFLKQDYVKKDIYCNKTTVYDSALGDTFVYDTDCTTVVNYQLERRIFHSMESLVIVTKLTPNDVPYWDGYSYLILKSKIVPRIFWKEKPNDRLGNEFGQRYNVLHKVYEDLGTIKDETTSWNMPLLNEFYVNYGKKGVIYGMFVLGLIFSLITKIFTISNHQNMEKAISFFIFMPIFFLESHASLIFGALIQTYLVAIILLFILLKVLRKFY